MSLASSKVNGGDEVSPQLTELGVDDEFFSLAVNANDCTDEVSSPTVYDCVDQGQFDSVHARLKTGRPRMAKDRPRTVQGSSVDGHLHHWWSGDGCWGAPGLVWPLTSSWSAAGPLSAVEQSFCSTDDGRFQKGTVMYADGDGVREGARARMHCCPSLPRARSCRERGRSQHVWRSCV